MPTSLLTQRARHETSWKSFPVVGSLAKDMFTREEPCALTSYLCKSKLNFQVIIILTISIRRSKLKTLSGLLWLEQTLENSHLVVVLRLLPNNHLYLRFGQWPHCTLNQQLMLISSVTWLWLLSSSSWAEVWIAGESSSTSLANCGSTHLLEMHWANNQTFWD